MIAVVAPDKVDAVLKILREHGETATPIGMVVPSQGDERVTYSGARDLA
jgi:phosphoribosylformylglycinamidine cyclo-ligase